MNKSLFLELVLKFFSLVVGKITEKFNGANKEQPLLHKTMLSEEYSADLTWGATELNHSIVAADVVALDSSLPLKSRGSINNAKGTIPKLGVKFRKGEKDISDINVMRNRGTDEATVVAKIFDDVTKCIKSMDVRKEIMFLQGLSTGVMLVEDGENTGTGVRADFGYKKENIFYAQTAPWGEEGYDPIEDLRQMFDKADADSNSIELVMLSKKYFNLIRSSESGKKLVADFKGQIYLAVANIPQPSRQAMIEALSDEFGADFQIVNSTFKIENHDGSTTPVSPWAEANIVGLPTKNVGRLVYGTLAEETNPVAGVAYQKSGSHVLVSKYSKNDPLEEYTAAQAVCIPVIDGGDSIYLLHANSMGEIYVNRDSVAFGNEADTTGVVVTVYDENDFTVSQTASTSWLTVTKSGNKLTLKVSANETGSARTSVVTVTDSVDSSKTATINVSQASALSVSPDSLTFGKTGNMTGKKVVVTSDTDFDATTSVSWLTLEKSGSNIIVKCEANDVASAPERTATIVVTNEDGETENISVTQAANS